MYGLSHSHLLNHGYKNIIDTNSCNLLEELSYDLMNKLNTTLNHIVD